MYHKLKEKKSDYLYSKKCNVIVILVHKENTNNKFMSFSAQGKLPVSINYTDKK